MTFFPSQASRLGALKLAIPSTKRALRGWQQQRRTSAVGIQFAGGNSKHVLAAMRQKTCPGFENSIPYATGVMSNGVAIAAYPRLHGPLAKSRIRVTQML
jgi:hypothetical protein